MNKQKRLEKTALIKSLLFLFIEKQGYFDYWLDGDVLFAQVARTADCSIHKVKRVFFKDIYLNNKDFIDNFEY